MVVIEKERGDAAQKQQESPYAKRLASLFGWVSSWEEFEKLKDNPKALVEAASRKEVGSRTCEVWDTMLFKVIKYCERALELEPQNVEAWRLKMKALVRLARMEGEERKEIRVHNKEICKEDRPFSVEAARCAAEVLKLDPPKDEKSWREYDEIFTHAWNSNEFSRIKFEYDEKVLRANPNATSEDWWSLARYMPSRIENAAEKKLEFYDKALALDPKNVDAWFGKGVILQSQHAYEKALECYEKALALDPQRLEAWTGKGEILQSQQAYEKALECYEKAIELEPSRPGLWKSRIDLLKAMGRQAEADEAAKRADARFGKMWENY